MPCRPILRLKVICALAMLACAVLPAAVHAWDYTEISVINPVIVDGNPSVTVGERLSVIVRAMNDGGIVDTNVNALLFELYTTHDVTLPPAAYMINGEVQFDNIAFNAPGTNIQIEALAADDPTAPHGYVWINCYPWVDHFNLSLPPGDKTVGQILNCTIRAVDAQGVAIRNFADDVTLSADIGHLGTGPTQLVSGPTFVLGETVVPVQLLGTHVLMRENTLNATGSQIYPGQPGYPTGSVVATPLWPADLDGVILLVPGESLTPGIPPGKAGSPSPQLSGVPFEATVYAVDPWWNPVLDTDPAFPVNLAFGSSDGHPGVVLPPAQMLGNNVLPDLNVELVTAALQSVSVTATGPINDVSNSYVEVSPQGLDHFEFNYVVWDTLDVQVTTQPFNIRITARDFFDNLYDFDGDVSLRVRYGADESEDYILAASTTFVNGILNTDIQVTRRFFSCMLICDSGGSAVTPSGSFQVNPGPLETFLITLPGETYAPGLNTPGYGGNLGTPNPAVAGQLVSPTTVRPVDAFYNMVGGSYFVGASSQDGYFQIPAHPDNNFVVTNATEVDVLFRTLGQRSLTITSSLYVSGTSSHLTVSPADFDRLVVVAPGETLAPGIFDSIEDDGKTGDPDVQDAGIPFSVVTIATDAFWNPVGESDAELPLTLDFASTDPIATLPADGQIQSTPIAAYSATLRTLAGSQYQTVEVSQAFGGASAFAAIPLQAGVIDHFSLGINSRTNPDPNDPLDPVPDVVTGQLINDLTVIARDQFGNHIPDFDGTATLSASHGTGIVTPAVFDFADGGTWPGAELGVWRGNVVVTMAGVDVVLSVIDDTYARTGSSNPFDVTAGAYADLLLLLPGEVPTPGLAPGKIGNPYAVTTGETVTATVMAVDAHYNLVAGQPTVLIGSEGYSEVTTANPTALDPDGTFDAELYMRTAGSLALYVADVTLPARADTSLVSAMPGAFARLQIIAPGEVANPGGYEADGKLGTPDLQTSSLQFPVEVLGVDAYWNQVDNNDEHVQLVSSDGALNAENPPNQGQNLSGGRIEMPIFLVDSGSVVVEASPLDNLDILPQSVTINLLQGSTYVIVAPDSARVGPPQTFPMSISLVDSLGNPESAANNTVTLTALKSNLDPASSVLWVGSATLNAGTADIPAQAYETVEDIIIRVTDDAGRIAFSDPIHMIANGLEYHIDIPDGEATIAGPPETFPVVVELRDTDTGTAIRTDRELSISIWASVNGAPGLGTTGTTEASLVDGHALFNQSYTKAENVYIHVEDDTGMTGNGSIFTVLPDGYKRLQLIVPGEEVRPGEDAYLETGKTGAPDRQRSRIPFPVTVRAVDQYWNLADDTNEGAIRFSATDNSAGDGNPVDNDAPFVNGRRSFSVYLDAEGQVGLSVVDADDAAPPGQTVTIPVDPGYEFRLTVPNPTPQTGFPGFQFIVEMIDPLTDDPAPDANQSFTIAALNTDLTPAAGTLAVTDGTLAAGVLVINDQQYDRAERIVLRVADGVDRVGYSPIIDMQPGGLAYEIDVPDSATVGGPSVFGIGVRLVDLGTGLTVTSQDTVINIQVFSAQTGQPGLGEWSVGSAVLENGTCAISQTYTAAEVVYLRVDDPRGIQGISPTFTMLPDGYKRLQVIAPGETPVPGITSPTGKTGEPLLQQAEVPFMLQVRATDQYWNVMREFAAGAIRLSSSDFSLGDGNPTNQDAPLINGVGDYSVLLHNPGSITVVVEDLDNPNALAHSVTIPVDNAGYQIITPGTALAGPPAAFPVTVRLVRADGSIITNANNEITLTALLPNHAAAMDTLAIQHGILAAGELTIAQQSYATVEDIVIRVTDDLERVSYSDVIHIVPEDVTYEIDVPTVAVVGPPETFTISLRLVDTNTGQLVTSADRSFTVTALDHGTGEAGMGVLAITSGATEGGLAELPESYTAAETIYFRIEDDEGTVVYSNPVQVRPGLPHTMSVARSRNVLEVNESATITVELTDLFGNLVVSHPVAFRVVSGDGVLETDSLLTGALGTVTNVVSVPDGGREDIVVAISLAGLPDRTLDFEVIGPPLTTLTLNGSAVETSHGLMITPETTFTLESASGIGLANIYYGLDLAPGEQPQERFTGELAFAELGITDYGEHTLSFYADDIRGNRESMQVFTIAVGMTLAANKPITNRPNPFQAGGEETLIIFRAREDGQAAVRIYDHFGNLVWNTDVPTAAGEIHQVPWRGYNGRGELVANGGYICVVTSGGDQFKRKIAVLK